MNEAVPELREDLKLIGELIPPRATVLDLGCGAGELLSHLVKAKQVKAQGIDIDEQAIYACVARGLSVFHGDIDTGLAEYRDRAFDYVILNQSLQQVKHLDALLDDALRVGGRVIVGFPNFAHYRSRAQLFFLGKAPMTPSLPYTWYSSPNLHFLSIADFLGYCRARGITVESSSYIGEKRRVFFLPNLFALTGLFVISRPAAKA